MNRINVWLMRATWSALCLVLFAGCAGKGQIESPEALAAEITVERLGVGRSGFVLHEETRLEGDLYDRYEQGVEALEEGDFEAAVDALSEVVETLPAQSAPYINLSAAYLGLGRPQEAERPLQRALGLVPGHPLASHRYGLLLRREGRFAEARKVYEESLEEFPEYHPIRRNLAILSDLYLGDLEYALEQYEIYAEERPDDEQVAIWIADLRARLGQ